MTSLIRERTKRRTISTRDAAERDTQARRRYAEAARRHHAGEPERLVEELFCEKIFRDAYVANSFGVVSGSVYLANSEVNQKELTLITPLLRTNARGCERYYTHARGRKSNAFCQLICNS